MGDKSKKVKVRVLADLPVDGNTYKPNDVVAFELNKAKTLEKAGLVDATPDAVAYALSQGAQTVEHDDGTEEAEADGNGSAGGGNPPAGG